MLISKRLYKNTVETLSSYEQLTAVSTEYKRTDLKTGEDNYTIQSYSTKSDGSGQIYGVGSQLDVRSDIELYPQWKLLQFDVSFYNEDELLKTQRVDYGASVTPPTDVTKQYWDFNGWQIEGSGLSYVSADTVCHAMFSKRQLSSASIQMKNYEATGDAEEFIHTCDEINPTITHGGQILVNSQDYTLSYFDNVVNWTNIDYGQSSSQVAIVQANAIQDSYYIGSISIAFNITYTRNDVSAITVHFDPCGGNIDPDQKSIVYTKGEAYGSLPIATRTGYGFLGWYESQQKKQEGIYVQLTDKVESTIAYTLSGDWQICSYVVTFDANGHGTAPASQTLEYMSLIEKPTDLTTSDPYDFKGWYGTAEGTNKWDFDENKVENDMTLYAKWDIQNPTVGTYYEKNNIDVVNDDIISSSNFLPGTYHISAQAPSGYSYHKCTSNVVGMCQNNDYWYGGKGAYCTGATFTLTAFAQINIKWINKSRQINIIGEYQNDSSTAFKLILNAGGDATDSSVGYGGSVKARTNLTISTNKTCANGLAGGSYWTWCGCGTGQGKYKPNNYTYGSIKIWYE